MSTVRDQYLKGGKLPKNNKTPVRPLNMLSMGLKCLLATAVVQLALNYGGLNSQYSNQNRIESQEDNLCGYEHTQNHNNDWLSNLGPLNFVQAADPMNPDTYMTDDCQEKFFPFSSGGAAGDEYVTCTLYDEKNDLIIVVGNTTSTDYVQQPGIHAFAYAVTAEDAHWKWGKYFYNSSQAIQHAVGCQIAQEDKLIIQGKTLYVPVIAKIDIITAQIDYVLSIDFVDTSVENIFSEFGALYFDPVDFLKDDPMFYISFIHNEHMQIIKINEKTLEIEWNYKYIPSDVTNFPTQALMIPRFFHQDREDVNRMYMIGQFNGRGSVIKFKKNNMQLDWRIEVASQGTNNGVAGYSDMNSILSFVQPENSDSMFGCGYSLVDPTGTSTESFASFMKMDESGRIQFLYRWGRGNLFADAYNQNYDICKGIEYDSWKKEIVVILEVTSEDLRPMFSRYSEDEKKQSEIQLIFIKTSGIVQESHNINLKSNFITDVSSLILGDNALRIAKQKYIFAGASVGFESKYQSHRPDENEEFFTSFLFNYSPKKDNDEDCLHTSTMTSREINAVTTKFTNSNDLAERFTERNLFKLGSSQFKVYKEYSILQRGLSSSFDLSQSFSYPRMCAYKSVNHPEDIKYYLGQMSKEFFVSRETDFGSVLSMMQSGRGVEPKWVIDSGENADGILGTFEPYNNGGLIQFKTSDTKRLGPQRTSIRGCSIFNQLLEIALKFNVERNSPPYFLTSIQKDFDFEVGDVFNYNMPKVTDSEDNDDYEIYVRTLKNFENWYPPFMFFDNNTYQLQYRPHSIYYQGYTYRFELVLKEKNSDTMMNTFKMSAQVIGEIIDPETYLNFTDITFKIKFLDRYSYGALEFNNAVNTTFIKENFDSIFHVYIKNITYFENITPMTLDDFEITNLTADNKTMNFRCKFHDPYLLGLLVKRKDTLYIHMRYDLLDTDGVVKPEMAYYNQMFFGNASLNRIFPEICRKDKENTDPVYENTENREKLYATKRINIQFDFRNDEMSFMRKFAVTGFYYLCGVIVIQFIIMQFKGLSMLPLWTIIEYMQLASYLPLFNYRLIPYLYDAFKPFLVSHLILTNDAYVLKEFENDYFNINYDYYWLNIAKMAQALALICCLFGIIVLVHIMLGILYVLTSPKWRVGKWVRKTISQFHFNIYIRYYMLCYFDLTFFSVMKIVEGNNSTAMRELANMASMVIIAFSMAVPFFFLFLLCWKYKLLRLKDAKKPFSTLLLKVDKRYRSTIIVPFFFFVRRFATAVVLSFPLDNKYVFFQYAAVTFTSNIWALYVTNIRPYKSTLFNVYIATNETFYSMISLYALIFTDSQIEIFIKLFGGIAIVTSIFVLVFANFLMVVTMIFYGKQRMKKILKEDMFRESERLILLQEEKEYARKAIAEREAQRFGGIKQRNMKHQLLFMLDNQEEENEEFEMIGDENDKKMDVFGSQKPKVNNKKKNKKVKDSDMDDVANPGNLDGDKLKKKKTKRKTKINSYDGDSIADVDMGVSLTSFKNPPEDGVESTNKKLKKKAAAVDKGDKKDKDSTGEDGDMSADTKGETTKGKHVEKKNSNSGEQADRKASTSIEDSQSQKKKEKKKTSGPDAKSKKEMEGLEKDLQTLSSNPSVSDLSNYSPDKLKKSNDSEKLFKNSKDDKSKKSDEDGKKKQNKSNESNGRPSSGEMSENQKSDKVLINQEEKSSKKSN